MKKKLKMHITEAEREVLWKNVKNMIPQFKKSEIVNHFKKEGYKVNTIYNIIGGWRVVKGQLENMTSYRLGHTSAQKTEKIGQ